MNKEPTETIAGIAYSKPTVVLLQETGIGTAEIAARTCYDSFDVSEHKEIVEFNQLIAVNEDSEFIMQQSLTEVNGIEHSDLLDKLAWTHFHHSILEHANLTFLVKGTSRGVLQEHARHRIQAISVRSTRYTMGNVINAFVASIAHPNSRVWFGNCIAPMNMFVTQGGYNMWEIDSIWNKLNHQRLALGTTEFTELAVAKSSLEYLSVEHPNADKIFEQLQNGKKKRNVGDNFKHLVSDNWKVDMVVTFNLRSLKNYFELRDSGAAYFQIRWLAQAMKAATPNKYLDLIVKTKKI